MFSTEYVIHYYYIITVLDNIYKSWSKYLHKSIQTAQKNLTETFSRFDSSHTKILGHLVDYVSSLKSTMFPRLEYNPLLTSRILQMMRKGRPSTIAVIPQKRQLCATSFILNRTFFHFCWSAQDRHHDSALLGWLRPLTIVFFEEPSWLCG